MNNNNMPIYRVNGRVMHMRGLVNYVKPDMEGQLKKYRRTRTFCGIGLALSFVLFGIMGALMGVLFMDKPWAFALILIPFFGFAGCGFGLMTSMMRVSYANIINDLMQRIKNFDKILLVKLADSCSEAEMYEIVDKLINTGNLPGYRMVGDLMVARESVSASIGEAKEEYDRYMGVQKVINVTPQYSAVTADPYATNYNGGSYDKAYCPSCGKEVDKADRFCPSCGRKL
ncbi:MAG: zinc ribbon domain-containing protein [Clostridiales bacterium]|jgi:hypothetical protein|nr:zinc ribbon domain-containing protein [Clostridiales bacterium]MDY4655181.1 zinc ribbon domain-containing protein [Eubacteriales bacterium]